ncbi:MAG: flagellar motor protein MotB [Pseudomonadota bacterium]|nr:flagellar motor protein MotB [Pseudomonadota bacterium]
MSDEDEGMNPEPPSMDWLLTFADLVSLLITFFVLLYSMKVVDVQKWDELKGSFSGVFSIREPIYKVSPDKDTSVEKIDPLKSDSLEYVETLLSRAFQKSPDLRDIAMRRSLEMDTLTFTVPSDDLFEDSNAELTEEGAGVLRSIGDILRHLDNRIVVAVHTDPEHEATKQFPSNWELTMIRAIRVAEVMESQGIVKSIVTTAEGASHFDEIAPSLPLAERYKLARKVDVILYGEKEL